MMRMLTLAAAAALLAGCGEEHGELRAWMDEVRRTTQPVTEKIPEPKRFEPFRYANADAPDPFSSAKLAANFEQFAQQSRGGLRPDLSRRREPLESFPLDTIRMVGHMSNASANYALLQVDRMVYQARVGNYAGQNFGMITKISETEVVLKELVQDAAGDWVERHTSLQLQEGGK